MIPLVLMIMILEPRRYTACPFSRGYITFYSLQHMNKKYVDIVALENVVVDELILRGGLHTGGSLHP